RLTAKSPMACKASSSTKSPTASPCAWPFSISAEELRRERNTGLWPVFRRKRNHEMSATIIRNGRLIDPANKRNEIADLLIADGKIAPLSQLSTLNPQPDEIDASNLIVCPGLIDMHVHLREPGFGHKET